MLNVLLSYLYLAVITDINETLKELSKSEKDEQLNKRALERAMFSPRYNIYFSWKFTEWLFLK